MSSSSAPLSPSKRTNDAEDRRKCEAKRAKKVHTRADEAAAPSAAAPAAASSAGAKPSTQELYDQADPARAIRPLSEVNPKWQYQLHVRCEKAIVGFLSKKDEARTENYNNESFAYRDLIMSANASAFDLVKTLLCAFGLSDSPFNHANGLGSLDVGHRNSWDGKMCSENSIMLHDVQVKFDERTGKMAALMTNGLIRGLHVPSLPGKRVPSSVTAAQLKSVKLCQLLDKPAYSTPARSRDAGVRSAIFLNILKPERVAHVSAAGGVAETAAQALYLSLIHI